MQAALGELKLTANVTEAITVMRQSRPAKSFPRLKEAGAHEVGR